MGGAFSYKEKDQCRSTKNLHPIIWSAGTAKGGCKKTKNQCLEIQEGALNLCVGLNRLLKKTKKTFSKYVLTSILSDGVRLVVVVVGEEGVVVDV